MMIRYRYKISPEASKELAELSGNVEKALTEWKKQISVITASDWRELQQQGLSNEEIFKRCGFRDYVTRAKNLKTQSEKLKSAIKAREEYEKRNPVPAGIIALSKKVDEKANEIRKAVEPLAKAYNIDIPGFPFVSEIHDMYAEDFIKEPIKRFRELLLEVNDLREQRKQEQREKAHERVKKAMELEAKNVIVNNSEIYINPLWKNALKEAESKIANYINVWRNGKKGNRDQIGCAAWVEMIYRKQYLTNKREWRKVCEDFARARYNGINITNQMADTKKEQRNSNYRKSKFEKAFK